MRSASASLSPASGSPGRLEEIARRLALLQGKEKPEVIRKRLLVFAASHGEEPGPDGLTPGAFTGQRVRNFMEGRLAVNVVARQTGIGLRLIDLGVADALPPLEEPCFVARRIPQGTAANGLPSEAWEAAMEAGREQVRNAAADGVQLLGTGRMGRGGETGPVELVQRLGLVPKGKPTAPQVALQRAGNAEMAAMAGVVLEAGQRRIPVVLDSFFAAAGAAAAWAMEPQARKVCFFAQSSPEPRHRQLLNALDVRPLMELESTSEEGVGAALGIHFIELAARIAAESE